MKALQTLSRLLFLPDLSLTRIATQNRNSAEYHLDKVSEFEVCPKCAKPSKATYDHRSVRIKDEPVRGKAVTLVIRKRRFWCSSCYKPFTEPVSGISKSARMTQRFKRAVANACREYENLSLVQKKMRCSSRTVYEAFYSNLEQKEKQHRYPLPSSIGIDEHSIKKPKYQGTEYVTMIVDHKNKKNLRSD